MLNFLNYYDSEFLADDVQKKLPRWTKANKDGHHRNYCHHHQHNTNITKNTTTNTNTTINQSTAPMLSCDHDCNLEITTLSHNAFIQNKIHRHERSKSVSGPDPKMGIIDRK